MEILLHAILLPTFESNKKMEMSIYIAMGIKPYAPNKSLSMNVETQVHLGIFILTAVAID